MSPFLTPFFSNHAMIEANNFSDLFSLLKYVESSVRSDRLDRVGYTLLVTAVLMLVGLCC